MIYLASPYTYTGNKPEEAEAVERKRYQDVCKFLHAEFLKNRTRIYYSPIAIWHPIAERLDGFEKDFHFFKEQNELALQSCTDLVVLALPGWKDSLGVASEVEEALALGLSIAVHKPVADA